MLTWERVSGLPVRFTFDNLICFCRVIEILGITALYSLRYTDNCPFLFSQGRVGTCNFISNMLQGPFPPVPPSKWFVEGSPNHDLH
jgi:hypothetical protein